MSIYIDNGTTIKYFITTKEIEQAIETLLKQTKETTSAETLEGIGIRFYDKEENS